MLLFIFCLMQLQFAGVTMAAPLINYQGVLTNDIGNAQNGTMSMEFALYDEPVAGNMVWGEAQSDVQIENGTFHVLLGDGALLGGSPPLTSGVFANPNLWLQVTVSGVPITPRWQLASAPFAMRVEIAEGVVAGSITASDVLDASIQATDIADATISPAKMTLPSCGPGEILVLESGEWGCRPDSASLVQECFEAPQNQIGIGECKSGVRDANGTCVGQKLPISYEPCMYTAVKSDFDCDGVEDEGCGCLLSSGRCDTAVAYIEEDGSCTTTSYFESPETTCDGRDNDCDGDIDEGCN